MKFLFTHKDYQTAAVNAVADCFAGQSKVEGTSYRLDPGKRTSDEGQEQLPLGTDAFRNASIELPPEALLANIRLEQVRHRGP